MNTYQHPGLARNVVYRWKRNILSPIIFLLLGLIARGQSIDVLFQPASPISATAGQTFTVDVRLHFNSGDIDVAGIHFDFDNTKLAVVSATNSSSISLLPTVIFNLQTPAVMNTNGRVSYSATTAGPFPSTDFTVISVTFRALQAGTTQLTFRRPPTGPPNTNIVRNSSSVLNTVTNATVNIANCTSTSATISNSGTCNSQAFDLVLQSATGASPYDLVINGTTYNDVTVGSTITTGITFPVEKLWPANDVPDFIAANDIPGTPIELGTKFQSAVAGFVKGVRFYRGENTSVYTGKLYDAAGNQLASVVFPSAADGWQEALFTTPVQIAANTTYIVAYNSSTGFYSFSNFYFNTSHASGNLTALAGDGSLTVTSNGLYRYGGGFPGVVDPVNGNSFQNGNYWVDVLFSPQTFAVNLTSVTDNSGCINNPGTPIQTLTVTSNPCSSLPVGLINFSATPQNKNIILRWTTEFEANNKGFEVQRSLTGKPTDWQVIGFVNGAGNSTSTKNYTYTDLDLSPARYYYRLKQVDHDGTSKLSTTVNATINGKIVFSLEQNFPNPFRSEGTTIRFTLPEKVKVNLSVYDMHGRLVKTLINETKDMGTHAIPFNTGTLTSGVYYYKMQAGDFSDVKKMTIR